MKSKLQSNMQLSMQSTYILASHSLFQQILQPTPCVDSTILDSNLPRKSILRIHWDRVRTVPGGIE